MSTTVEQSFVKYFQADVHLQYQQMGSKLRNTVRVKDNIIGASTTFQKVGKGTASTKARHGKVPVMNIDHTPVECQLSDFYAGDWVDSLDELKANTNERTVTARAGAYALGRKTDELIITQFDNSTNYAGDGSDGLTKDKVLTAFEMLGEADVPDDGDRYAAVGWKQWSDLLNIQEFANADYVGEGELPWRGTQAKKWLGALWIPHSGLTKQSSVRYCYWYHRTAIGHAIGSDVKTDVTWHGDRAANFINNWVDGGVVHVGNQTCLRLGLEPWVGPPDKVLQDSSQMMTVLKKKDKQEHQSQHPSIPSYVCAVGHGSIVHRHGNNFKKNFG